MLLGIVIGFIVAIAVGAAFVDRRPRENRRERMLQAQRAAARHVDDLLDNARIRMEEAAGWRQPGERRLGDGLGSWRRW